MHQARWLHKTNIVGPMLYEAVEMEGAVRHNRKVQAKHRNLEGHDFLDISDARLADEINSLTNQFHGVRPSVRLQLARSGLRLQHAC
jgi:hypothetical protein